MLTRQKTILALLSRLSLCDEKVGTVKSLNPTVFVKLVFLLRHETELESDSTFYNFVPYKFGPFSFTLYRELANMRHNGYLASDEKYITLHEDSIHLAQQKVDELPVWVHQAVNEVVSRYGKKSWTSLIKDIYARYPWYASKSELTDFRPKVTGSTKKACPAVYTAGYEGESVDSFFNRLLKSNIELIIDVRANPISRKYGFSKRQFSETAKKLGVDYCHMPKLGIPSKYRVKLGTYDSYQRLLNKYGKKMLPCLKSEIREVVDLMLKQSAVLVCMEKDVGCCHRSQLADAVSQVSGLKVTHL